MKSQNLSKADVQFITTYSRQVCKVVCLVHLSFFIQCDLDIVYTVLWYSVHSMYIDI